MTDEWRVKRYYDTRVMIETARVLDSQFDSTVICLTGAELEMLRNLTQYLHRHSTFVSEYQQNYYLAPSNDEWDAIDALVASLENKLMGECLDDLVAAINAQTDVIASMTECVCAINGWMLNGAARLPPMSDYINQDLVSLLPENEIRGNPTAPATDEDKCELAQAFWYYVYQMYTEDILPFLNNTADTLTNAVVGASAFGAIALFVGIPELLLASIVLAIVAWGIDGSIENFISWMLGAKDELICALYNNYPDYDAASAAIKAFIDTEEELSFLDKQFAKVVFASAWHMSWVSQDQQDNGTWDTYLVPGQCDTCEILPETCLYLDPCDVADWYGGTISCHSGWAWIDGGTARYELQTRTSPAYPAYIVLSWIPRTTAGDEAEINVGVYDTNTTIQYLVSKTGLQPKNVQRIDAFELPAATAGHVLKLVIKQEGQYGEPRWWCVLDHNPLA